MSSLRTRWALSSAMGLALGACGPTPSAPERARALHALSLERAEELDARETNVGSQLPDLPFTDIQGRAGAFSDYAGRLLVVAVRDVGCPVSQRTAKTLAGLEDEFRARGVAFLFLNLSAHNTRNEIAGDVAEHGFDGPTIHDPEQHLGTALAATTTTEVFLLDGARTLVYRGAIDDQTGRGTVLREARNAYLRDALEAALKRERVLVAATSAPGCLLGLEAPTPEPPPTPTYHREVARLLQQNCVECHRAGGVAPFALETYEQAHGRKAMLRFVVEERVMPPWFASDDTGPWANDRRLSSADRATLLAWVEAGAPAGDPADAPVPYVFPDGWRIGEPDLVFAMKEPFTVPASGVVDTRYFEVGPEVEEDLWIQRLEVRPEARSVVHHVTVSYQPPVGADLSVEQELRRALLPFARPDNEGWVFLFGYLPGKGPRSYPDGIARFLPKGAKLRFDMHYTPNGKAVPDQTRLGLVLAKAPPEMVAESRNFWNREIRIPPHAADVTFTREYPLNHDVLLRSLTPHMHLRGKSMLAELLRPGEAPERLIEIPAWDQNWQFNHVFRTLRFAPAGSKVRVTATFDNSSANPANPDPDAWVLDGPQTADEMMSLVVEWIRPRLRE